MEPPIDTTTFTVTYFLLDDPASRQLIQSWRLEEKDVVAKRIQQYMFNMLPEPNDENNMGLLWNKLVRLNLKEIDWNIVAEAICT